MSVPANMSAPQVLPSPTEEQSGQPKQVYMQRSPPTALDRCLFKCCCVPNADIQRETPALKKVCCIASMLLCGSCILPVAVACLLCRCITHDCSERLPHYCPRPIAMCVDTNVEDFANTFCINK